MAPPPPPGSPITVKQQAERVLFFRDPKTGESVVWVEVQFNGAAADFGWVVPMPSRPKVGVGTSYLFDRLDQATAPRFVLQQRDDGGCIGAQRNTPPVGVAAGQASAASGGGCGGGGFVSGTSFEDVAPAAAAPRKRTSVNGVQLVEHGVVGPYDYAIIDPDAPESLQAWLKANKYVLPPAGQAIAADHVKKGDVFVALRLQQGETADRIRPVTFTMKDGDPCVPLRLTSVAAVEDMTVVVYTLGGGRAVPKNAMQVELNPVRIEWASAGDNYGQVLAAAVDEAGGRAFVTEFAGPTSDLAAVLPQGDPKAGRTVRVLAPVLISELRPGYEAGPVVDVGDVSAEPLAAVTAVGQLPRELPASGIPITDEVALLLDAAAGIHGPLSAAISRWSMCSKQQMPPLAVNPSKTIDGPKLAKEIDATVVQPLQVFARALAAEPVLTRLTTRISPGEMTRDPIFAFRSDVAPVRSDWSATLTQACSDDGDFVADAARLHIGGFTQSWIVSGDAGGQAPQGLWQAPAAATASDDRFRNTPAARSIAVYDETGPPRAIAADQIELVDTALAGAEFGKASLPPALVLKPAPSRWTPPPSDSPLRLQELAAENRARGAACSQGRSTRVPAVVVLLALAGLAIVGRRRAW